MVELYPPGLNHAGMHATTGDMPLTDQPVTFEKIVVTMTTAVAGQIAAEVTITSSATSGTATGVSGTAIGDNASGDQGLKGVYGLARVPAGIDAGSGALKGVHGKVEVLATGIVSGRIDGVYAQIYAPTGSTMGSDICGLYVDSFVQVQPTGAYELLRLEHNGAVTVEELIGGFVGGDGDISYFLALQPNVCTAWGFSGSKTGAEAGWLKCWIGGNDRYIQLWTP